jgi:CubicO group peptidase (beta-lactamase class C family)
LKKSVKGIICACFLVFFSASMGKAGDSDIAAQVVEELKALIPDLIKNSAAPGTAVAIVDDKSILWQTVFGNTSREEGKPITPETLFSIQSMSKSFTTLGVLIAVQEGMLDLDTPITEYIPDFTVNSPFEEHPERKMTLRILLSHRAGFTHEAPLGSNYDDRPHTFDEHILSISDSWLRYPVGYRYSYSNLGVDLAGYILQEMAGMPFWEYMQKKVLDPLGMKQSSMDIDRIMQSGNRAIGHVSAKLKVEGGIPVYVPMVPAGGMYANVIDLAKYMQFHMNSGRIDGRQLLEKDLFDLLHAVSFPEDHQKAGSGLSISKGYVSKTYTIQMSGGGYGFISSIVVYPEIDLGVVTLCNSHERPLNAGPIVSVVNRIIEEKLGKPDPVIVLPTVERARPVNIADERIQRLRGRYERNIVIGPRGEEFGIHFGRDFYPMEFYLDAQKKLVGLFGDYSELRVKPPLWGKNGTLVHLNRNAGTCRYYDFHTPEESRDRPGPDKPEWKGYTGLYFMLEWGRLKRRRLFISVRNGHLYCNNSRCIEYRPGLFFTYHGEALDMRGTIPTYANVMLIKFPPKTKR